MLNLRKGTALKDAMSFMTSLHRWIRFCVEGSDNQLSAMCLNASKVQHNAHGGDFRLLEKRESTHCSSTPI